MEKMSIYKRQFDLLTEVDFRAYEFLKEYKDTSCSDEYYNLKKAVKEYERFMNDVFND